MTQIVIYPNGVDGTFSVIVRVDESLSTEEIAAKDVPAGIPYKIVDSETLPPRALRESWTADFARPDGVGKGHGGWVKDRPEKK